MCDEVTQSRSFARGAIASGIAKDSFLASSDQRPFTISTVSSHHSIQT